MAGTVRKEETKIQAGSPKGRKTLWKAVSRIQHAWDFKGAEMARLLHAKANTFHNWKNNEEIPITAFPLTPDMEAVVTVLAVHRSLSAMFSNPRDQVAWLQTAHPDFIKSPLEFAQVSTRNLFYLRDYLDFVRGVGA